VEALVRYTMCAPAPILRRPGLGALGAASDPVASNTMAGVPRRKAPSVDTELAMVSGYIDPVAVIRVIKQVAEPRAGVLE
jgi:hypothetical protein